MRMTPAGRTTLYHLVLLHSLSVSTNVDHMDERRSYSSSLKLRTRRNGAVVRLHPYLGAPLIRARSLHDQTRRSTRGQCPVLSHGGKTQKFDGPTIRRMQVRRTHKIPRTEIGEANTRNCSLSLSLCTRSVESPACATRISAEADNSPSIAHAVEVNRHACVWTCV